MNALQRLRPVRKAIVIFARWLDYQLWGLEPPRPHEYRRAASITCYRHGQRRREAAAPSGSLFATGDEPWR